MVTNKNLIKDMEGVPLGVARLMCIRQYEATGKIDMSVFQKLRTAGTDSGALRGHTRLSGILVLRGGQTRYALASLLILRLLIETTSVSFPTMLH